MRCPHRESADTTERERTALGYQRLRCHTCQRECNERTGMRINHLQYPTDIVCLVGLWCNSQNEDDEVPTNVLFRQPAQIPKSVVCVFEEGRRRKCQIGLS